MGNHATQTFATDRSILTCEANMEERKKNGPIS